MVALAAALASVLAQCCSPLQIWLLVRDHDQQAAARQRTRSSAAVTQDNEGRGDEARTISGSRSRVYKGPIYRDQVWHRPQSALRDGRGGSTG